MRTRNHIDNNRRVLLRTLFENEIKALKVHFDGSGDSGEINEVQVTSIDDEIEISEGVLASIVVPPEGLTGDELTKCWTNGEHRDRDFKKNPVTLYDLILTVCYGMLNDMHGGWELNAGSYGDIFIDVPFGGHELSADAISIDYTDYPDAYDDYEEEEYNDE